MARTIRHWAASVLILLSLLTCAPENNKPATESVSPSQDLLDTDAITCLLDLLDTIVVHNPDFRETNARLSAASPSGQERILDSLTQRNAGDSQINALIDSLLSLPAYRLCYAQFRNVTPEIHRNILINLPHRVIDSPAGISSTLMELCRNRSAVRDWMGGVVSAIDLNRPHRIALAWLPPGDYSMPKIHFIYDGNGDAFAGSGEVCFDLYSIVFAKRSDENRFFNLAGEGVNEVEGVLAHEMQHIYAAPYLYPPGRTSDTWQNQWIDRITRRFVSEGIAMQCNPPQGFRREIKEDSGVVRYWIGQLNEKFAALKAGTVTEPEFESWYRMTYHDTAREVLERFGKRAYPDVELRRFVAEHLIDRPSFDYTLGWWMISRILQHDGKDKVIGLLSDPAQIFTLYNATVLQDHADLIVNF